jgi:hypothetical protein
MQQQLKNRWPHPCVRAQAQPGRKLEAGSVKPFETNRQWFDAGLNSNQLINRSARREQVLVWSEACSCRTKLRRMHGDLGLTVLSWQSLCFVDVSTRNKRRLVRDASWSEREVAGYLQGTSTMCSVTCPVSRTASHRLVQCIVATDCNCEICFNAMLSVFLLGLIPIPRSLKHIIMTFDCGFSPFRARLMRRNDYIHKVLTPSMKVFAAFEWRLRNQLLHASSLAFEFTIWFAPFAQKRWNLKKPSTFLGPI